MSSTIREWLINIGVTLTIAVLVMALRAGLVFLRSWGEAHIKNVALKSAMDYVLSVADTLVQSSAEKVRVAKGEGSWSPEMAKRVRDEVIANLNTVARDQLTQLGKDATPEQIETLVKSIVESRVEGARK